jgi:hypothetical protein
MCLMITQTMRGGPDVGKGKKMGVSRYFCLKYLSFIADLRDESILFCD